jgi:hypothetical protein
VTLEAPLSLSERSLPGLNDRLCCALVVIHNVELEFTCKNIEVLYLLFSLFTLKFYFDCLPIFFDNITLCTNLQNVTLSNMTPSMLISHFMVKRML